MRRIIPLSPVFSQEFAPDTQSQPSALFPQQGEAGALEAGRRVRTSFTALSLALSLGAVGSLVSSAEAADSMQLAALPSVAGGSSTLPSFGSSRPDSAPSIFHTVTDGETIWGIAEQHGLTPDAIRVANGMADDQVIQVGQVLKVPAVESDSQGASVYSVSALNLAVSPSSDETKELTVAALPEATVPAPLQVIEVDEPQSDVFPVESVDSPLSYSEQSAQPDVSEMALPLTNDEAASRESSLDQEVLSKTDLLRDSKPLASLPATQPQVESVQQFAEQLGAADEPAAPQKVAADAAINSPRLRADDFTHRVGSGETIWSIARSYGLNPDSLQELNQVSDSRSLMPGDELVIPGSELLPNSYVDASTPLPHRTASAQQTIAAASAGTVKPTSSIAVDLTRVELGRGTLASAPSVSESTAVDESSADPFVANLLSQATSSSRQQAEASVTPEQLDNALVANELRDAEVVASAPEIVRNADEVALNPQFVNSSDTEGVDIEAELKEADNLLAAAPLGSEVYSPIVESPTGRVVTPEMPVLPEQDAYLPEAPNRFDGYMWPAQGVLTSGYGWRWGRMHRGVDIAGPVGTPIYAAASGVVVSSGWNSGGYGNLVDIRHPDGSMTRYAHNSRLMVRSGQQVRQGQQIAEMGSTGFSTGPHLHFEIHIPNQGTVNPMAMLPNR